MRVLERKPVPEYRVECVDCQSVLAVKMSDLVPDPHHRWVIECPVCTGRMLTTKFFTKEKLLPPFKEPEADMIKQHKKDSGK